MPAAQPDQIAREAMEILHMTILALEPVPPDERVRIVRIVGPKLVFEEFLSHEEHRRTGGGEQDARSHAGATARIPGARIAPVGKAGNARLAVVAVHIQDKIVVFDAVVSLPGVGDVPRSFQRRLELSKMYGSSGATGCFGNHVPH